MGRWKALPFGSREAQDSQAARRHLSARNLLVLLQKGWFYIAICIHLFTESAELPRARHERKSWAHQTTGNNQISTLGLLYTVWYNPMKKPKKQREPIKDGWDWKVSRGVSWGTDLWNWRMNVDYVEKGQAAGQATGWAKGKDICWRKVSPTVHFEYHQLSGAGMKSFWGELHLYLQINLPKSLAINITLKIFTNRSFIKCSHGFCFPSHTTWWFLIMNFFSPLLLFLAP